MNDLQFNRNQNQIIIGGLMGDSCIHIKHNKNHKDKNSLFSWKYSDSEISTQSIKQEKNFKRGGRNEFFLYRKF